MDLSVSSLVSVRRDARMHTIGWLVACEFRRSQRRTRLAYVLTPHGRASYRDQLTTYPQAPVVPNPAFTPPTSARTPPKCFEPSSPVILLSFFRASTRVTAVLVSLQHSYPLKAKKREPLNPPPQIPMPSNLLPSNPPPPTPVATPRIQRDTPRKR